MIVETTCAISCLRSCQRSASRSLGAGAVLIARNSHSARVRQIIGLNTLRARVLSAAAECDSCFVDSQLTGHHVLRFDAWCVQFSMRGVLRLSMQNPRRRSHSSREWGMTRSL